MKASRAVARTVDDYIAAQPKAVQTRLRAIRRAVRKAAPGVEERISYQIPAFKLDGQYLIYVAAFKAHLGVYPAPTGDATFAAAAAKHRSGKATLQFPHDEPLPLDLLDAVLRFRKRELLDRATAKGARRR
ncbi:MAG: iron chaperone [Vicinamibacterales bacterium]